MRPSVSSADPSRASAGYPRISRDRTTPLETTRRLRYRRVSCLAPPDFSSTIRHRPEITGAPPSYQKGLIRAGPPYHARVRLRTPGTSLPVGDCLPLRLPALVRPHGADPLSRHSSRLWTN